MSKHLALASQSYNLQAEGEGIHPISFADTQVIAELVEVIKLAGLKQVADILSQWKNAPDTEILTLLMEVGEKIEAEGTKDQPKSQRQTIYIDVGPDNTFIAGLIYSIRRQGKCLVINEDLPAKNAWYLDTVIEFPTEAACEVEKQRLKTKLMEHTNCIFL